MKVPKHRIYLAGLNIEVWAYLKTKNMLVSFVLGDANLVSFAIGDVKVPNANGFASQWNIGNKVNDNNPCQRTVAPPMSAITEC